MKDRHRETIVAISVREVQRRPLAQSCDQRFVTVSEIHHDQCVCFYDPRLLTSQLKCNMKSMQHDAKA